MQTTIPEPALDYCRSELRRHDRERYLTTLFAPAEQRPALLALYAFNLEIARTRETVSEPMLGQIRLQWWREALGEVYAGTPRRHQVVELMAVTLPQSGISEESLLRLVDARARDLDPAPFATMQELNDYVEGTAAGPLLLALDILGVPAGDSARQAAVDAGLAYGLAGLLRAVPYHAARSRLFLPQDLLHAAGLRADQIRPERAAPGLADVVRPLATQAEQRVAQARTRPDPAPAAVPALLVTSIAEHHLRRLRRCAYDPYALPAGDGGIGLTVKLCIRAWRGRF